MKVFKTQINMKKLLNKTIIYLILIVTLAVALRIARAVEEKRYSVDAYLYFDMAKDMAYYGTDYTCYYDDNTIPPLLPWIMAMGYNLGLSPEYTGIIVGVLLGSLMPLAAFGIVFYVFPRENNVPGGRYAYALLAAFLVAVHPFLVRISVSCLREILYLPLMAFAVACAISAIYNKSLFKICLFAVLASLASLSRREGILLVVIFFAWQFVEFCTDRKYFIKNFRWHISASLAICLIFMGLLYTVLYILSGTLNAWSPFYIPDIKFF